MIPPTPTKSNRAKKMKEFKKIKRAAILGNFMKEFLFRK
jgi:hypothetical protein